jgi:hypothetical protein
VFSFAVLGTILWTPRSEAQALPVKLTPVRLLPQPVGAPLRWVARLRAPGLQPLFRFEVSAVGGEWRIVQDYGTQRKLRWTSLEEGSYDVRVSVLDPRTGATGVASKRVTFVSRVTGGQPAVSATDHPLVALYSAPPCGPGTLRVRFRPAAEAIWQTTPARACHDTRSYNQYVAGMRVNTPYVLQQVHEAAGTISYGPELAFLTGSPPFALPGPAVPSPPDGQTSQAEGMLLTSFIVPAPYQVEEQVGPIATDLAGNLLWYDPRMVVRSAWGSHMFRSTEEGTMLLVLGHPPRFGQGLREVDLAGLTVRETTVAALNLQLAAMGLDPISYISHEAVRLANGHTLVLTPVERLLTDVQGPGTVNVLGYMVLDLDPNLQIVWTWNAFDFLDARRKAVLGEVCADSVCGQMRLGVIANDWIHANTIARTPDGNLLISMRHQDWIVKIDYRDGAGTGEVLWRLGHEGDFTLENGGDDPWPWFSHQHQVGVLSGNRLIVYDNANTRKARSGGNQRDTNSRGQVLLLDEAARTARLLVNADLGVYSSAWGSAQLLANGNYHFMSGLVPPLVGMKSESLEVLPDGTPNYRITWETGAYRSFRMKDIYSPP